MTVQKGSLLYEGKAKKFMKQTILTFFLFIIKIPLPRLMGRKKLRL